MTLAAKLEERFRHELAEARVVLAPMLEEPFYQASSLTSLHAVPPLPALFRTGLPALFRTAGGGWWAAGSEGPVERPATCGETLDKLEELAPAVAEYEARSMTLAGELLEPDADTRAALLERVAEVWPWTNVHSFGDFPAILPNAVGNLVELMLLKRDGNDSPQRWARRWAPVNLADVIAWTAEGLERRGAGKGERYREWCDGSALVRVHSEIGAKHVEPRRTAWPGGIGEPEKIILGTTADNAGELVSGVQLSWLYWALPPAMRHARALLRDVERIASGDEQRRLLERVAPAALAEAKAEASEDARGKLAEAVRREVGKLRPRLRIDAPPPATEAEALELLNTINEGFAVYLETRGDAGATVAREMRAAAAKHASADAGERWVNWQAEPDAEPPWLVALAVVVWLHETKREVTQRPALVMQVHDDVTRIYSRASVFETRDGQRALTFDDSDPIVLIPTVGDDVAAALVERGAGRFGSLAAHRALRWEVFEGHARVLRHEPDARALRIEGGWSTFAHDVLGLTKKSAASDLKEIVHAQAAVVFRLPDGSTGNMLALHERPQQGRRRGSIEIVLGSMLLPFHGKTLATGADHRLVPMLRDLPPMVGRPNEHGALATLSMHVLRELRVRARELVTDGGVTITQERWEELAYQSRLSLALLPDVLERWLRDGDDAPALLASPWKGGYTLGDAHEPERDFLVAAGRDSLNASEGGKRSVQVRARKKRGRAGR